MSGTTSVPVPTFGPTGFIAPAESAILAGVQADVNAAFGGVLTFTTTDGSATNPTPQGQLAASETAIIGNSNDLFLLYCNQVDPAYASGRMQDGIARIYFITRNPALPTVVTCLCTGLVNVPIPTGALASDGVNLYICVAGGTIPAGGSIALQFANVANGPIPCAAGAVNKIAQAVSGWDTITNPAPGVLGVDVETRSAFETRRGQSVAKNSIGSLGAILGAVLSVAGVLDAYVISNDTGATATIGGISIGANELYVAAIGGDPQAIAQAIWSKKLPGGPYYAGNTTETVLDSSAGYSLPYPSYSVTFETPASTPVYFLATIANSPAVPSNALALVQTAIIAAFAGTDGGLRARIGSTIYASRFYCGIAALGAWAQIIELQVGTGSAASFTGSIAAGVLTVSAVGAGALAAGQLVVGGLVAQATTILAQLTGSAGGAGTYSVSVSQAVASGPMITVAMANSVAMTIAQAPVTAAGDINLTLV